MQKYVLALDQGTTSSRALLFDKDQELIGMSQREITQYYPQPGWVEHDPMEIFASQYGVLTEVMAQYNISASEIAAVGITNQRETTIVWEKATGRPVCNAIVWQCRRTASICAQLEADGMAPYIKENTGLVIDAYFSGTKIKWILDNVAGAREKANAGELLFGTVDTWLIWKLTEGKVHATDHTNASRTMLYNINTLEWDKSICEKLGIPLSMLPEVKHSCENYGEIVLGGVNIPIGGVAGDQQAALFGQACFEKGDAKNTYGTGCFLLMNNGEDFCKSESGLLTTIAATMPGRVQYALEGSIFVAGAAVQWLRDEMKFISEATDSSYFASKLEDNGGVYFVPAFTGLGAPEWDMYARGTILGLTRGSGRNHIIRAALESIAYQTKDVLDAMEADTGTPLKELRADGGASANPFLMQFQADIIGRPVYVPVIRETTALGAAYLAGLSTGFFSSLQSIKEYWSPSESFTPQMPSYIVQQNISGWKKAIEKSKNWA